MEPPRGEVLEHSRTEMITALVAGYRDRLADDEITAIATAAWDQLRRGAQVATYLPLLTRRVAGDRVRSRIRSAVWQPGRPSQLGRAMRRPLVADRVHPLVEG